MTGTERAALRLALGMLRRADWRSACWYTDDTEDCFYTPINEVLAVLWEAQACGGPLWQAVWRSCEDDVLGQEPDRGRILRARLALYIRAVLRADANNYGDWWRFDGRLGPMVVGSYWPGESPPIRLARPLWQGGVGAGQ